MGICCSGQASKLEQVMKVTTITVAPSASSSPEECPVQEAHHDVLERLNSDDRENFGPSRSTCPYASTYINHFPQKRLFPINNLTDLERKCQSIMNSLNVNDMEIAFREKIVDQLKMWQKIGKMDIIESHALSALPSNKTLTELAQNLTSSDIRFLRELEEDQLQITLAKAYSIYAWISVHITLDNVLWQKHLEGKDSEVSHKTSPRNVLHTQKTIALGYAKLFQALATHSGLEAQVVTGNLKSFPTRNHNDDDFKPCRANTHHWNVVKVHNILLILDCSLGSGCSSSTGPCVQFNRSYFAMIPHQCILTHWPSRKEWQLLDHSMSLEDQQPLVAVPSSTFAMGVIPQNWSQIIPVENPELDPLVTVNLLVSINTIISARLVCITAENPAEVNDATFAEQSGESVCIRVALPGKGDYLLNVYVQQNENSTISTSSHNGGSKPVLTYKIQCHIHTTNKIGFPRLVDVACSAFSFQLLEWNIHLKPYVCENSSGKIEFVFKAKTHLQFYHYIQQGTTDNSIASKQSADSMTYLHCTMLTKTYSAHKDVCLYCLHVVFPHKGLWTVFLSASHIFKHDTRVSSGFTTLFSHKIFANTALPSSSYPHVVDPHTSMCLSDPIYATGREPLTLLFRSEKLLDFHSFITFDQINRERLSDYVMISYSNKMEVCASCMGHHYELHVVFPIPGKWYVQVYGKERQSSSEERYFALFTLHIDAPSAMKNTVYPQLVQPNADILNVSLVSHNPIQLKEDVEPLELQFKAPAQGIDFFPVITPASAVNNGVSEEIQSILQHCTFLTPFDSQDCHNRSSASSDSQQTHHQTYTLYVIFPWVAKWLIEIHAAKTGACEQSLIFALNIEVNAPSKSVYPVVYPAFHQFNLALENQNRIHSKSITQPEFEFQFSAPYDVHFSTKMHLLGEDSLTCNAYVHLIDGIDSHLYNRILHVVFPKLGKWIIQLHACKQASFLLPSNDQTKDNGQSPVYEPVLQLMIEATALTSTETFPHLFNPFHCFGMKFLKENLPLAGKLTKIPSLIHIHFYAPPTLVFWHNVEQHTEIKESETKRTTRISRESTTRMTSHPNTGLHDLEVEITSTGKWIVSLHAQYVDINTNVWTPVLEHIVSTQI